MGSSGQQAAAAARRGAGRRAAGRDAAVRVCLEAGACTRTRPGGAGAPELDKHEVERVEERLSPFRKRVAASRTAPARGRRTCRERDAARGARGARARVRVTAEGVGDAGGAALGVHRSIDRDEEEGAEQQRGAEPGEERGGLPPSLLPSATPLPHGARRSVASLNALYKEARTPLRRAKRGYRNGMTFMVQSSTSVPIPPAVPHECVSPADRVAAKSSPSL